MRLDTTHDADGLVARHWTILEKSLGVLRQGFDPRRGERIACIHEVGEDLAVEWLTREAAAQRLRKLSERAGGLRGFRELAQRLVAPASANDAPVSPPASGEEPTFDCLVLADGLLTHFEIAAPDPRQEALDRVANLVATLRGLRAATFDVVSAPPGLGYVVRSPECVVCVSWAQALTAAGVWTDAMQAPVPVPHARAQPNRCVTCVDELEAAVDAAQSTLQLGPQEVRRASEPGYVLAYLGLGEA
jgi:hypothetical protein